ncbi:MAG: bile acid:sodium symporter [Opitutales bacterium]
MKKGGFILALLAAVGLAILFPQLGAKDGVLRAGLVSQFGVMVIFLLQGLILPTRKLAGGLRHPRLHLFTQGWIFIASAAILLVGGRILLNLGLPGLADGFFFLALLPTTISSAVILSSAAGGDVPSAIFNVSLANILGVFWVPTACLFIFSPGDAFPIELMGPLLWKIARLILLPLIVGQVLRPFIYERKAFIASIPWFKVISNGIILFIVFASFSQGLLSSAWDAIGPLAIGILLAVTLGAVILIHSGNWLAGRRLCANHSERVTALFCGSQKTLAAGAPIALAVFSGSEPFVQVNLGLLLLPLLCYHSLQLLLGSMLLPFLSNAR